MGGLSREYGTTPHYMSRYVRGLYTELFYAIILPCFPAVLISLNMKSILLFFTSIFGSIPAAFTPHRVHGLEFKVALCACIQMKKMVSQTGP